MSSTFRCRILTNVEDNVKKVRLNLKRGFKTWSFTLYDSAESAFYLRDEPIYNDAVDEEYRKIITLKPGEIIEAEWVGAEWVYNDVDDYDVFTSPQRRHGRSYDKYDKVKIGKFSSLKGTTQKLGYLETYSGWISDGVIPWTAGATPDKVRITQVKDKTVSGFDLSNLFVLNQEIPEDEPEVNFEVLN